MTGSITALEAGGSDHESVVAHALDHYIKSNAERFPNRIFIESVDQDKRITFGEFYALTNRLAHFLHQRGIRANDRVALLSGNSIEHLAVYIGVMRYGAAVCTVHVEMNQVYFGEILAALAPKLVFWEDGLGIEQAVANGPGEALPLGNWSADGDAEPSTGLFALLADCADTPDVAPVNSWRDDASIFYTSGTASTPKGVILSYAELMSNIEPTADMLGMTENDRILEFRAFNWVSAQALSGLCPVARGAQIILARKFSRSRYFDWVRDHKVTIGVCNPSGIAMFLNERVDVTQADIPHLRFMTSSSAPLPPEQWRAFEGTYGIQVAQSYGASETSWIAGSNETNRRMRSVGMPFPYHQLSVVDADGQALPTGETGEVELGGDPDVVYRYLTVDGKVQQNARGRARTGDLGYLDEDGYLYLVGRAKDLIIRGGVNISPAEIDNIVLQMEGVAEAATIGVPDQIYGEEVVVYLAPRAGESVTIEGAAAHCTGRLPEFRMPKSFVIRDSLPKTDRGKMDRLAILEDWKQTGPDWL